MASRRVEGASGFEAPNGDKVLAASCCVGSDPAPVPNAIATMAATARKRGPKAASDCCRSWIRRMTPSPMPRRPGWSSAERRRNAASISIAMPLLQNGLHHYVVRVATPDYSVQIFPDGRNVRSNPRLMRIGPPGRVSIYADIWRIVLRPIREFRKREFARQIVIRATRQWSRPLLALTLCQGRYCSALENRHESSTRSRQANS